MSKNELVQIATIKKPKIPKDKDWDFKAEDKAFDENIRKWRRFAKEVVCTLWVFYNKLKGPGRRTDLPQNCGRLPTWEKWLKTKGISPNTPLNHFKALGWLYVIGDYRKIYILTVKDLRNLYEINKEKQHYEWKDIGTSLGFVVPKKVIKKMCLLYFRKRKEQWKKHVIKEKISKEDIYK